MNTLPSQIEVSQETFSKMRISSSGPYGGVCYIWYKTLPKELSFEGPEFNLICNRLLAGYSTKEKLLAEMAELSLAGTIPADVNPEILAHWVYWIRCNVKIGADLI